ncbi:MAG: hypothetical protein H0T47_02165 [Planctomycetaceae bacterium]|nr:hypothetical protein [Planctomycetaceae bacterium]
MSESKLDENTMRRIVEQFNTDELLVRFDAGEVSGPLSLDLSFMLSPRLERAALNQLSAGEATMSRYVIWAETVRGIVLDAIGVLGTMPESVDATRNLTRAANSLAAFAAIQSCVDTHQPDRTR